MNENNSAKAYFSKGVVKTLCGIKAVCAILMLLFIIMVLVIGGDVLNVGILNTSTSGKFTAAMIGGVLIDFLPVFVLIGMSILWAVSLTRASSPDSDGSPLRSTAASSLTLSVTSFIAVLGLTLILISAISASSSSGYSAFPINTKDAQGIISFILTVIGVIFLLPTAIMRSKFYSSVQKSISENTAVSDGATAYAAMKLINAVVKAGYGILMFVNFIQLISGPKSSYGYARSASVPASYIILYLSIVLAFLFGAAGNIVEAIMVMGFKKVGYGGFSTPFPAYASAYPASPNANSLTPNAYPGYSEPAPYSREHSAPDYPGSPYADPDYGRTVSAQPQVPAAPPFRACPSCGTPIQPGNHFCKNCRKEL